MSLIAVAIVVLGVANNALFAQVPHITETISGSLLSTAQKVETFAYNFSTRTTAAVTDATQNIKLLLERTEPQEIVIGFEDDSYEEIYTPQIARAEPVSVEVFDQNSFPPQTEPLYGAQIYTPENTYTTINSKDIEQRLLIQKNYFSKQIDRIYDRIKSNTQDVNDRVDLVTTTSSGISFATIALGGTGISAVPNYGELLMGDGSGGYTLIATSSLGISSGGSSQWTTNGSDIYYTTGSVGIGTTTPSTGIAGKLVVEQTHDAQTAVRILNLSDTPNAYAELAVRAGNVSTYIGSTPQNSSVTSGAGSAGRGYIWSQSTGANRGLDLIAASPSSDLRFFTGGYGASSERMRITSTGDVGIGTTTPQYGLHIYESIGSASQNIQTADAAGEAAINLENSVRRWKIKATTASGDAFVIRDQTAGQDRFVIGNTGNIGIGSTSPYAKLSVAGTSIASTTLALRPIASQTANVLDVYNSSGSLSAVITAAGNVGIGTASPSSYTSLGLNHTGIEDESSAIEIIRTVTQTGDNASFHFGLDSGVHWNLNGFNQTGDLRASYGGLAISGSGGTATKASNFYAYTTVTGAANVANLYGTFASLGNSGTGVVDTITGSLIQNNASGVGTVNNFVGYQVQDSAASTTVKGFVGNIASGTGKYNLYMNGTAQNYFAGNIGIGTTTPSTKFQAYSNASRYVSLLDTNSTISNIFRVDDNSAANIFTLENRDITAATNHGVDIEYRLANDTTTTAINAGTIRLAKENLWTTTASTQDSYFAFSPGTDGAPSEKMRIVGSTGNVGIGTTTPGATFDVNGTTRLGGLNVGVYPALVLNNKSADAAGVGTGLQFKNRNDASNHMGSIQTIYRGGITSALTMMDFFVSNAVTPKMTLDGSGNLGIGTTTPAARLDVAGTIAQDSPIARFSFGGTWNDEMRIVPGGANGTNPSLRLYRTTGVGLNYNPYEMKLAAGGSLQFNTGSSAAKGSESYTTNTMTLSAAGNVGIGTTTPSVKLETYTTGTFSLAASSNNGSLWFGHDATTNFIQSVATNRTSAQNLYIGGYATQAPALTEIEGASIFLNGNVGIGTSTPQRALSIYKSSSPVLQLTDSTAGESVNDGFLLTQSGLSTYLENTEAGPMYFRTSAANRMVIGANGNVGIGTTSPTYKLEVAGDVGATSFINMSSRSVKKDITYVPFEQTQQTLDKIKALKFATYRYVTENDSEPLHLGLIAEESPEDILAPGGRGIDVYKLATFALQGIQSLIARIEKLEAALANVSTGFTDIFKAKTVEVEQGITIKDSKTGEYYCIVVENGSMKNIPGKCGTASTDSSNNEDPSDSDDSENNDSSDNDDSDNESDDTSDNSDDSSNSTDSSDSSSSSDNQDSQNDETDEEQEIVEESSEDSDTESDDTTNVDNAADTSETESSDNSTETENNDTVNPSEESSDSSTDSSSETVSDSGDSESTSSETSDSSSSESTDSSSSSESSSSDSSDSSGSTESSSSSESSSSTDGGSSDTQ